MKNKKILFNRKNNPNLFALFPDMIQPEKDKTFLAPYRTSFMRDRDRILYCRPFLRLGGKTQVYGTGYDDHARNRLTHSLEVAQIGKTIAAGLNTTLIKYNISIDVDLVEAISLGHDLGHTPFGHAGEREINDIMCFKSKKINELLNTNVFENFNEKIRTPGSYFDLSKGFKHNWQSVRIVQHLSRDHISFNMKLNKATVAGMLLHSSLHLKGECPPLFYTSQYMEAIKISNEDNTYAWSLETLVVSLADEIAQRHHDLEDAISCHYLTPKRVIDILDSNLSDLENKEEKLQNPPLDFSSILKLVIYKNKDASMKKLNQSSNDTESFLGLISKYIVNWLVTDCIMESRKRLESKLITDKDFFSKSILTLTNNIPNVSDDIYKDIITFSPLTHFADKLLQYRLKKIVLNSRNVQRMDKKGSYIIRKLFAAYIVAPQQMPDKSILAIFREYVRRFYPEKLEILENRERYLFQDAADARMALDYCYKKPGDEQRAEMIIFAPGLVVEFSDDKFNLSLLRVIADYISGMTDSYAEQEYRKLYGIDHDIEAY